MKVDLLVEEVDRDVRTLEDNARGKRDGDVGYDWRSAVSVWTVLAGQPLLTRRDAERTLEQEDGKQRRESTVAVQLPNGMASSLLFCWWFIQL